jgi:DNA-binding NarL/FixJ family response regulator
MTDRSGFVERTWSNGSFFEDDMRNVIGLDGRQGGYGGREPLAKGSLDPNPLVGVTSGVSDLRSALLDKDADSALADSFAGLDDEPVAARTVALIEGAEFLRECIARGLGSIFAAGVEPYASSEDYLSDSRPHTGELIVFSTAALPSSAIVDAVSKLAREVVGSPILVLSYRNDVDLARAVLEIGAKGFIPGTMEFQLVLETARFVAAGGSYLPAELLSDRRAPVMTSAVSSRGVTSRELEVVKAIRQGKPNKIIAHELNMCESTVKVHIRHVMKKLQARNRTDIAIKSAELVEGR